MRFVFAGVLFVAAVCIQVKCILIFSQMKVDVNRALPQGEKIPEFGPSLIRGKIIRLHKQHYPGSDLAPKLYKWWWAEMVLFVAALVCVIRFV